MVITKGWNPNVQNLEGEGYQDKGKTSQYPRYRRTTEPGQPTLIPSPSQGVDQPNSPVAPQHSGTSISVAKSNHSSQFQVDSRRIQESMQKTRPLEATGRKSQTQLSRSYWTW
ncbi:hypothetical protein O181_040955 [Austropuccinia psidii MF-1]|uniref:Uncharacterized protein n=1 Tax=Austropuccinia psidii MF-1 TaxID=1389203 RepID=A0A9Q3DE29_9BASI|nr:hypothetical protein [Austropuccinia psidii MF-1]